MGQKTPNARQGITTVYATAGIIWNRGSENPQCPTGHYDFTTSRFGRSSSGESENPQCPTGHYICKNWLTEFPQMRGQKTPNARQGITTSAMSQDRCARSRCQKTPNARQGITTYPDAAISPHGRRGQKTPNARQGITTSDHLLFSTVSHWSENPQCPTGHYDGNVSNDIPFSTSVRKPPMPDRALRLTYRSGHKAACGVGSENPQCPTGHYDLAIRSTTVRMSSSKSENPQCPTGHYDRS